MARHDDFGLQVFYPLHCGIKIVGLEPQQDPIAVGLIFGIADRSMVVFDFEPMQLES